MHRRRPGHRRRAGGRGLIPRRELELGPAFALASAFAVALAVLTGCGGGTTLRQTYPAACPSNGHVRGPDMACFPQVPVGAPRVIAPGRIRLAFQGEPWMFDRPESVVRRSPVFVVVDETTEGEELVALGRCPVDDGTLAAFATGGDGSLHALCLRQTTAFYSRAWREAKGFQTWQPPIDWIPPAEDTTYLVREARIFPDLPAGPAALVGFDAVRQHAKEMSSIPAAWYSLVPGRTAVAPPSNALADETFVHPPDMSVWASGPTLHVARSRTLELGLTDAGDYAGAVVTCKEERCVVATRVHRPSYVPGGDVLHVVRFEQP